MKIIHFTCRDEFHNFLEENYQSEEGMFIKFGKRDTPNKLKPDEALEEALSYGWIDGLIKRLDEDFYLKYFSKRRPKSIWSTKNKTLATKLIKDKLMKDSGLYQVNLAKKDGRWDRSDLPPEDFSIEDFSLKLSPYTTAYENFLKMSPSIQKIYALSYYALKKEDSRQRKFEKIIQRLTKNLLPM